MSNHRKNYNQVPASAVMLEPGALTTVDWAGVSPSFTGMRGSEPRLFTGTPNYPGKPSIGKENPHRRNAYTNKSRSSSSLECRQSADQGKRLPSKRRNEIFSASALN